MNFIVEILLLVSLLKYLNWQEHIIAILAIFVLVKVLTWLFLKFIAGTIKESAMQIKKDLGKRTLKNLKESD